MKPVEILKKSAFVDIFRGMRVTGGYFVANKVTVEYPKEKLQTFPRFRGVHALLSDAATGELKCVACMLCATICPSECISVVGRQTSEGKSRPETFDLDLSRCIYCGLCEEVCPEAAIVMTRHYELATYDKSDLLLTKAKLIANQQYACKEVLLEPLATKGSNEDAATDDPSGPKGVAS